MFGLPLFLWTPWKFLAVEYNKLQIYYNSLSTIPCRPLFKKSKLSTLFIFTPSLNNIHGRQEFALLRITNGGTRNRDIGIG